MDDNSIGKGWSFPPHFTKADTGLSDSLVPGVIMTSGQEEIESSLSVLFSTKLGQRLFRPDFGCDVSEFQFKALDNETVFRLRKMIDNAVREYEPRIDVDDLDIDYSSISEGKLRIAISYTIKDESTDANQVYHFDYEGSI